MTPPLSFSVIVCTRGRAETLARTLRGLRLLRRAFELIVVHDPADGETAACITRYAPAARVGFCAEANLAHARNIGLRLAAGDVAAFIDDDSVPEPDWLDRLADAYAAPAVQAAGGYIRDRDGVSFQARIVLIDPFGGDHKRRTLPRRLPEGWFAAPTGTNFSIRRTAALALGGFDETYSYFLEETDLLWRLRRAGGEIAIAPAAEVLHLRAASPVRDDAGTPRALRTIARSKAYYCARNAPPEGVDAALRRFARGKARRIQAARRHGRLSPEAARALHAEIEAGFTEGAALARNDRRLLAASGPVDARLTLGPPAPEVRLCVLVTGKPEASPLWDTLIRLAETHAVSVFAVVPGTRRSVAFAEGMWIHRLPRALAIAHGGAARMLGREVRRYMARRGFTHVLGETPALAAIGMAQGLTGFTEV